MLSPISVARLLVLPIRTANVEAEAAVQLFVTRLWRVMLATSTTASTAATVRVWHGPRLPDAFILTTAAEHRVDAVVGNDALWKRLTGIRCLHIADETDD